MVMVIDNKTAVATVWSITSQSNQRGRDMVGKYSFVFINWVHHWIHDEGDCEQFECVFDNGIYIFKCEGSEQRIKASDMVPMYNDWLVDYN